MEQYPPRIAAVLILVYPRAGDPHVVFTERSQTLRHHAGQISLPGGSYEPSDPSLEHTALRETEEEVGVPAHGIRLLGSLGPIDAVGNSFRITPFVGVLATEPVFQPQPSEVAKIIEVPLAHLRDPGTVGEDISKAGSGTRRSRFYGYQEHRIWGVTAFIVTQFLESSFPSMAAEALRLPAAGPAVHPE